MKHITSCFLFFIVTTTAVLVKNLTKRTEKSEVLDFIGCPYDNDFYYNGSINSPLWPNNYPPNDQCYYYLYASHGNVLSITFPSFDLQTCCDYVTIYDGQTQKSPILARFGGPNMTALLPKGVYYSSSRYALMTFTSDKTVQQKGFQMKYQSVTNTSPCNRDILLVINGQASVGNINNLNKQLSFLANSLTPTWMVGKNQVRVMINYQTDDDYAVIFTTDDLANNTLLSSTILSLSEYADFSQPNATNVNCLFRYGEEGIKTTKEMDERAGIAKVVIIINVQNPVNDQDYYEAFETAHSLRNEDDAKVILINIVDNLDSRLNRLAFSPAHSFTSTYDNLSSLVPSINNAICTQSSYQCGP